MTIFDHETDLVLPWHAMMNKLNNIIKNRWKLTFTVTIPVLINILFELIITDDFNFGSKTRKNGTKTLNFFVRPCFWYFFVTFYHLSTCERKKTHKKTRNYCCCYHFCVFHLSFVVYLRIYKEKKKPDQPKIRRDILFVVVFRKQNQDFRQPLHSLPLFLLLFIGLQQMLFISFVFTFVSLFFVCVSFVYLSRFVEGICFEDFLRKLYFFALRHHSDVLLGLI